jgi:hypothetical protein
VKLYDMRVDPKQKENMWVGVKEIAFKGDRNYG